MCKQDFVSCMMCWSTGGPERFGSSPEPCSSRASKIPKKNHPGSIGQRAKPPSLEVLDRKLDERMATAREHHLMSLRYGPCRHTQKIHRENLLRTFVQIRHVFIFLYASFGRFQKHIKFEKSCFLMGNLNFQAKIHRENLLRIFVQIWHVLF